MLNYILGALLLINVFPKSDTHTLTIAFEGVKYNTGSFLIGIYKDEESWKQRKPAKEIIAEKSSLKDGRMTFVIEGLEPGHYGLAVLDDANGNETVDFGWLFPKEGFGFSNYYHDSFRLPRFRDFAFDLIGSNKVNIRFRYLKYH